MEELGQERVVCPECKVRVSSEVVAEHDWFDDSHQEAPQRIRVVKCPDCRTRQVLLQEAVDVDQEDGSYWWSSDRVWPAPDKMPSFEIPSSVRRSILEGRTCWNAGAYNAASLMSRRAIEAIAVEFDAKKRTLFSSLKQLHADEVIDGRLYEWTDALRKHGNLAAHDTNSSVSAEDARDLLDFTEAICEYVFVMSARFDAYTARQAS